MRSTWRLGDPESAAVGKGRGPQPDDERSALRERGQASVWLAPGGVGGCQLVSRLGRTSRTEGADPTGLVSTPHMRTIFHRHRVAVVAAERVYYASHIEVLEPDHPERRFVAALCLYSHAVDTGQAGGAHYGQEAAERFARALLMPAETFARSGIDQTSTWPSDSPRRWTT